MVSNKPELKVSGDTKLQINLKTLFKGTKLSDCKKM